MKKLVLAIALFVGAIQFSNAQLSFGLKAGINNDLNGQASKYITLPEGYSIDSKSNNGGYHAGLWMRVKLPIIGFYVRPEIMYTDLKSEYTFNTPDMGLITATSTPINYSLQKIDVPVLLGLKFLGVGNVFLGPNVQYILKSDLNADQVGFSDSSIKEKMSVGMVLGAGIEFWKLGLDARFETGFTTPPSTDITDITNIENIANSLSSQKPNQLIIGLSYKF